jgi:hypothetical protein
MKVGVLFIVALGIGVIVLRGVYGADPFRNEDRIRKILVEAARR